jgi:hypothetical protein
MYHYLQRMTATCILFFLFTPLLNAQDTLYFDPANAGDPNQDGTFGHPYDNLEQVALDDNTVYLLKRGTTMEFGSITFRDVSSVVVSPYGSGERPLIITGQINIQGCNGFTIRNIEIFGSYTLLNFDDEYQNENIEISNCVLRSGDDSWERFNFGIKGSVQDIKIVDCEIFNIYKDGIYLSSSNGIEITGCYIHDINKQFLSNPDGSSGDCIQFIGCENIHIQNCVFDRSKTGKKFGLIFTEGPRHVVIEDNYFKGPKITEYGGASLHAGGIDFVVRRNIFEQAPTGIYNHASDMLIHNNQFIGNGTAIQFASDGSGRKIYNNVFYDNELGVESWLRQAEIVNNIVYLTSENDQAYHVAIDVFSNNFQNIEGTGPHEDAIIADPMFVDAGNLDFHLQSESPCIDAGQDVGIARDFARNPVPCNGIPDIGAFEYQSNCDQETNERPVAEAGKDTTVFAGDTVRLSGEGSYDPNNDSLMFLWQAPESIVLSNAAAVNPYFVSPRVDREADFPISLIVDDGKLKSKKDFVEVTVQNEATGIPTESDRSSFRLFPNPAGHSVYLRLPASIDARHVSIQIYNLEGKLLLAKNATNDPGSDRIGLSVADLATGVYICSVYSASGQKLAGERLIISK